MTIKYFSSETCLPSGRFACAFVRELGVPYPTVAVEPNEGMSFDLLMNKHKVINPFNISKCVDNLREFIIIAVE